MTAFKCDRCHAFATGSPPSNVDIVKVGYSDRVYELCSTCTTFVEQVLKGEVKNA